MKRCHVVVQAISLLTVQTLLICSPLFAQEQERVLSPVEAKEFTRRDRELVSVLHRQITENYHLSAELEEKRKPWWRRHRTA